VLSDRPDGSIVASRTAASSATATITPPGASEPGVVDHAPPPAERESTASTTTSAATIFPAGLIRSTWSPDVAMAAMAGSASRTWAATSLSCAPVNSPGPRTRAGVRGSPRDIPAPRALPTSVAGSATAPAGLRSTGQSATARSSAVRTWPATRSRATTTTGTPRGAAWGRKALIAIQTAVANSTAERALRSRVRCQAGRRPGPTRLAGTRRRRPPSRPSRVNASRGMPPETGLTSGVRTAASGHPGNDGRGRWLTRRPRGRASRRWLSGGSPSACQGCWQRL